MAKIRQRARRGVRLHSAPLSEGGRVPCHRLSAYLHLYNKPFRHAGSAGQDAARPSHRRHVHLDHTLHGQRDNDKLPAEVLGGAQEIQEAAVEGQRLSQAHPDLAGRFRGQLVFGLLDPHRFLHLRTCQVHGAYIRHGPAGFAQAQENREGGRQSQGDQGLRGLGQGHYRVVSCQTFGGHEVAQQWQGLVQDWKPRQKY